MRNAEKAKIWIRRAFRVLLLGTPALAILGLLIGRFFWFLFPDGHSAEEGTWVGAVFGALFAVLIAVFPVFVAGWFLLLVMLGQVADAIRGEARREVEAGGKRNQS